MSSIEYQRLNEELIKAGVAGSTFLGSILDPLETLVNTAISKKPYAELIIDYLEVLKGNELDMAIRALTEKGNKKAIPILIELFKKTDQNSTLELWTIGNALNVIDDKSTYPEILELSKLKEAGIARQMLFHMLWRLKSDEAYLTLIKALKDSDVMAHAIYSLGRLRDRRAIGVLEKLEVKKGLAEFRERKVALERLRRL